MYLSLRNFTFVHVCLLCSLISSNIKKNNEPELKLTEEQTFKIIELYHEETSLWNVESETCMNKDWKPVPGKNNECDSCVLQHRQL